jgi:hypothetical protein
MLTLGMQADATSWLGDRQQQMPTSDEWWGAKALFNTPSTCLSSTTVTAPQKDTDHALDLEGKSKDALGANRGLWTRITTVLGGGFVNVNAGGSSEF